MSVCWCRVCTPCVLKKCRCWWLVLWLSVLSSWRSMLLHCEPRSRRRWKVSVGYLDHLLRCQVNDPTTALCLGLYIAHCTWWYAFFLYAELAGSDDPIEPGMYIVVQIACSHVMCVCVRACVCARMCACVHFSRPFPNSYIYFWSWAKSSCAVPAVCNSLWGLSSKNTIASCTVGKWRATQCWKQYWQLYYCRKSSPKGGRVG